MTGFSPPTARFRAFVLIVTFLGLCSTPAWLRLRNPTLYADDVVRIVHLQTRPLRSLLFRPFNEHMAPLFEVVTWTTWELAGRRISAAPMALFLASCLPFALTLGLFGLVVRRELGSTATALAADAVFGLASHDGEVLNWYSASSFTWASAATLLAWLGSIGAAKATTRRGVIGWLAVSALGAFSGPAFSAIGLLAGPLAALRLILDSSAPCRRRWVGAVAPLLGMLAYLALCESFHYREVLASGLGRHVELSTALWNIGRAPVDVLVPGLLGVRNVDQILPDALELALASVSTLGLIVWAWRSPGRRPLILGGLALIVGGYAVTYGVRSVPNARQLINFQRYHLFPHLGLVLLIAPGLGLAFRRLDGRPLAMLSAANLLALAMAWAHLPQMKEHLRFFRFPEQPPTLAALDRLEASCRRQGITRGQVLAALDPIRPTWAPWDGNALELLPNSVAIPLRPDQGLREVLLANLSLDDREALCGGMDASSYRVPTLTLAGARTHAVARLVRCSRVEPAAGLNRFVAASWPAYLEYQLGPEADDARALSLSDVRSGHDVELWWADDDGRWSPNRTAWWRVGPDQDWALPLDRLPHWQRGHVRQLRVYFHEAGPVALAPPRLFR